MQARACTRTHFVGGHPSHDVAHVGLCVEIQASRVVVKRNLHDYIADMTTVREEIQ